MDVQRICNSLNSCRIQIQNLPFSSRCLEARDRGAQYHHIQHDLWNLVRKPQEIILQFSASSFQVEKHMDGQISNVWVIKMCEAPVKFVGDSQRLTYFECNGCLDLFAFFRNNGFQGFGKLAPQEVRQRWTPLPRVLQSAWLDPQIRTLHVPPVLPRTRERDWIHQGEE